MKRWRLVVALLALLSGSAAAQTLAKLPAPQAALEQRLGVPLPLEMRMVDSSGRPVRLGDYFGNGKPVLLVLGYYSCPQLCGLLMHGLLEALHDAAVPRQDWRIVGVSIDPADTPATARRRRGLDLAYAGFLLGGRAADRPLDLHLLTATAADSSRLAQRVGFTYAPISAGDPAAGEADGGAAPARFAHPAAVLVATPQGKVSRYLMGVRFEPAELKLALAEAAGDRVGVLSGRVALLCAHFDPRWGRHSAAVMNGMRAMGLLLAGALALWCWRRRAPAGGATR